MSLAKRGKKATTNEKISLLTDSTGTWNYVEIMKYFNFSYGKANAIIRRVEEEKGVLPWYVGKTKRRVKIDDVLEQFGTNRVQELEVCNKKKELSAQ